MIIGIIIAINSINETDNYKHIKD